jgi:RHS repeat-associated protein
VNTKNQLVGPPYTYDAAGNLTADGNHTYIYDAENRLTALDGGSTATYVYDALGRRMMKTVGSTPTDYVYDLSGNVVAEVNNVCASICWAAFYASMNGQLIAEYKNLTTYFFHGDHLGSARLVSGIGQDLTPNAGFEQGLTGWSASNSTLITDPTRAHSGNNYVQISVATGGGGTVMMSPDLAVQLGDQLSFGGWSYLESGGGGPLGWWLQVEDSNHNALSWINASPVPTTSSGWTFQSATYTVPSGVAYVALYSTIYHPTASSVLRADDGFLYDNRLSVTIAQNLDYLPFGELNSTDSGISTHKFTGDERDAETNLDHTQFRQYTSQLARWISPDPAGLAAVDPTDPQSWNRYAYVLNNPLAFIDPLGLDGCIDRIEDDGSITTICTVIGGAGDPGFFWCQLYGVCGPSRPGQNPLTPSGPVGGGGGNRSGILETVIGALKYAADRNRCAANNAGSAANALGISKDNFIGQSLLGNDFSSISQLITGPGRGDAAGQLAVSNPTPVSAVGITTKAILDWIPTSGSGIVLAQNGAGTYYGVGATTTTLGATTAGNVASRFLTGVAAVKLAADGVNYFSSLIACSLDPSKQ